MPPVRNAPWAPGCIRYGRAHSPAGRRGARRAEDRDGGSPWRSCRLPSTPPTSTEPRSSTSTSRRPAGGEIRPTRPALLQRGPIAAAARGGRGIRPHLLPGRRRTREDRGTAGAGSRDHRRTPGDLQPHRRLARPDRHRRVDGVHPGQRRETPSGWSATSRAMTPDSGGRSREGVATVVSASVTSMPECPPCRHGLPECPVRVRLSRDPDHPAPAQPSASSDCAFSPWRSDALTAPVSWIHSSDLVDPTPFLDAGQVVLTTGTQFSAGTTADFERYVVRLREQG